MEARNGFNLQVTEQRDLTCPLPLLLSLVTTLVAWVVALVSPVAAPTLAHSRSSEVISDSTELLLL